MPGFLFIHARADRIDFIKPPKKIWNYHSSRCDFRDMILGNESRIKETKKNYRLAGVEVYV